MTASTSGICSRISSRKRSTRQPATIRRLRAAEFFVFGHFENGVHRFLLRRLDEAAGVDDQDVGIVGARREFVAVARENAHHHLAIHEVFGASQADESDFRHGRRVLFSAGETNYCSTLGRGDD